MTFYIEKIPVNLIEEPYGIRLKTPQEEKFLGHQTTQALRDIVAQNFSFVKSAYEQRCPEGLPADELHEVSLQVVLHYLAQYNSWRNLYEKYRDCDLGFQEKDFDHPFTHDILLSYFKNRYPKDYGRICGSLANKQPEVMLEYERNRDYFYDLYK